MTSAPWVRSTAVAHRGDSPVALGDVDAGGGIRREHGTWSPPADVAAVLHPGEVDVTDRRVCLGPCCGEVGAETRHGEHPAAAGAAITQSSRKDQRPGKLVVRWHRDGVAEVWVAWVASGGDDHRARGARTNRQLGVNEAATCGGQGDRCEVAVEEREQDLGFGIAEPDVVLDEAGTLGREHQPGVQHADIRGAGGGEVIEDRLHERRHQFARLVGHRRRGVGAHSSGVRAGVALADALVVLGQW